MKFFFYKCFHSILKLFSAIHTLTGYMTYLALKMQFDTHSLAVVLLRFLTKIMLNLYISPWLIKKWKMFPGSDTGPSHLRALQPTPCCELTVYWYFQHVKTRIHIISWESQNDLLQHRGQRSSFSRSIYSHSAMKQLRGVKPQRELWSFYIFKCSAPPFLQQRLRIINK